ncbi:carbon-nitrogen hydrolase family protein [Shimia sp. CNT1-13L.2]|uniref:carbon-nitrogen hydrolase family protein n=1 Tax=Shimia sp. CNT1-13L.2 TaxID=2959663 RepID=UPI0020CC246C|nr:carbon-nitrogen hydrolase family protein [Shimia sp. CNT1-13L.2]MCP9482580.1 carbon-nitrogen hydrolase family protein [Shimia sp. CNT1-13L.2]
MTRVALLQMTSSDDPVENLQTVRNMMQDAAVQGAEFVLTPEVTNCVSSSRAHQAGVLSLEKDDETLAGLRAEARELGIWLLIGSLALKTDDKDGRFANRSFLIGPDGEILARYDKIHMFDVQVSTEETYRESDGYRPGTKAVVAETSFGKVGMTICYDVRFPDLHRRLAKAGADILTVPAAFSHLTGKAHWETLLRARAIETGCFVLAPAQTGLHSASRGKQRQTHGHSMAIAPWGEVLLDAGTKTGVSCVDLDLSMVAKARRKVPSLTHDRDFEGP